MASAEKFCLRWNDFESNISVAFRELREDKDFFDVTLACDDDQIQAHKVILSACSPFFRTILKRNRHEHPLLYLKGVKYIDLMAVLNFMYHGEVNVAQEELNSFLAIAEDLKVKGLTQNKSEDIPRQRQDIPTPKPRPRDPPERLDPIQQPKRQRPVAIPEPSPRMNTIQPTYQADDDDIQEVVPVKSEPVSLPPDTHHIQIQEDHQQSQVVVDPINLDNSIAMYEENYADYENYEEGSEPNYDGAMLAGANSDGNKGLELYEEMLRSMIEKVDNGSLGSVIQCTVCKRSYKSAQTTNLKNHIEAKHIDHVRFTCCVCGGIFSSRASFRTHSRNFHKEIQSVPFDVSQITDQF